MIYRRLSEWLAPEVLYLERPQARVELFKLAARATFQEGGYASLAVTAACASLVFFIIACLLLFCGLSGVYGLLAVAFGLAYAVPPVACVLRRGRIRFHIRRRLSGAGIHLCLKCGYDLRGLINRRCPECGTTSEAMS